MTTDELSSGEVSQEARDFVVDLLADGEWHSLRQIMGDLIRTPISEYAIRGILKALRDDPRVEAEERRASSVHGPAWWYRSTTSQRPYRSGPDPEDEN